MILFLFGECKVKLILRTGLTGINIAGLANNPDL